MDVFLTSNAQHPYRIGCLVATVAAWEHEVRAGRVELHVQDVGMSQQARETLGALRLGSAIAGMWRLDPEDSQRERHLHAHTHARGAVFALTDDDIVLGRTPMIIDAGKPLPPWNEYVEGLFADDSTLAMAAALPSPGAMDPRVSEGFLHRAGLMESLTQDQIADLRGALRLPTSDAHLWQVSNVGGVRFCRRGLVTADAPPMDPAQGGGYDATVCRWLRDAGHRVGYLTRFQATHLGYAWSTTWAGTTHAIPAR